MVQRAIRRHLGEILAIKRGNYGSTKSQFPGNDATLSHQRPKESGFPAPVRSDEADDIAALDRRREILDQGAVFYLDGDSARYCDLIATSLGDVEGEV